jgi:hypothetical protein
MKLKGFKNILDPSARTWHFCNPTGGIRSDSQRTEHALADERIFFKKLQDWGVKTNDYSFIVLDSGIGDHYAFKYNLPSYFEKNKGKKHVFFVCFPQVFEDVENITMASIADALNIFGDITKHNIYGFMHNNKWQQSLVKAYQMLYQLPKEKTSKPDMTMSSNVEHLLLSRKIQKGTGHTIIISPWSSNKDHQNDTHPKSYPFWNDLIPKLKNLGFNVVQIGRAGEPALQNVDEYCWSLPFKEIEKRISVCRNWISVDNFLPHMINNMKVIVPGIVIFSKSDPNIFGYEHNTNILKNRKYLRESQFVSWGKSTFNGKEVCEKQNLESFYPADILFEKIERIL